MHKPQCVLAFRHTRERIASHRRFVDQIPLIVFVVIADEHKLLPSATSKPCASTDETDAAVTGLDAMKWRLTLP